jgi:RNA recognition motif-containing protein
MSKSKDRTTDVESKDAILMKWKKAVVSILNGESTATTAAKSKKAADSKDTDPQPLKVKQLRKLVLLSMQLDDDDDDNDKDAKKSFKHTIQTLEMENMIHLDADGHITLNKKKKSKIKRLKDTTTNDDTNNGKKTKKQKVDTCENEEGTNDDNNTDIDRDRGQHPLQTTKDETTAHSTTTTSKVSVPCAGNSQGITRLFVGNLSFTIDETILEDFLPGLTHVKWITDKESGKFYGSAFIEISTSQLAVDAVKKAGQTLLGRPLKINFAPALPGDKWPPEKKVITGGAINNNATTGSTDKDGGSASLSLSTKRATAGGVGIKAMSVKPENCCKLFIGNLSYDINDEIVTKFFGSIDVEIKAVRWIHHKDTGDFKGVYVAVYTVCCCFFICANLFAGQ